MAPTPEQHDLLLRTMEQVNAACNYAVASAFEHNTFHRFNLHHLVYSQIREQFSLNSHLATSAINKTTSALSRKPRRRATFRSTGALPYRKISMRFKDDLHSVSITTLEGRVLVPLVLHDYAESRLREYGWQGYAELSYCNGQFYLILGVEIPTPEVTEPTDFLGVDLGINNLASDSDGEQFSGELVDTKRRHYEHRRSSLQRVGTKSSHKRLKQVSGKERRFKRDVNHAIHLLLFS